MQTTGQQQSKSVRRRRPMAVAADLRMTMRKSGSQSAPRYLQDNNPAADKIRCQGVKS